MSALTTKCKHELSPAHIAGIYDAAMGLKERLLAAREAAGLNKSELARSCDVDPSAISKLESGDTKSISGELLLKISAACKEDPFVIGGIKGFFIDRQSQESNTHPATLTTDELADALATRLAEEPEEELEYAIARIRAMIRRARPKYTPEEIERRKAIFHESVKELKEKLQPDPKYSPERKVSNGGQ